MSCSLNLFVPVTIVVCLSSLIMSVYNPLLERYFTDKAIFSSYFICFCQRPRNGKLRTISWRSLNMLHVNLLRSSKTFKWESFSKKMLDFYLVLVLLSENSTFLHAVLHKNVYRQNPDTPLDILGWSIDKNWYRKIIR